MPLHHRQRARHIEQRGRAGGGEDLILIYRNAGGWTRKLYDMPKKRGYMTTYMTSEAPSLSRTEWSFIADDMVQRKLQECDRKFRDRNLQILREFLELDESVSPKGDVNKGKSFLTL